MWHQPGKRTMKGSPGKPLKRGFPRVRTSTATNRPGWMHKTVFSMHDIGAPARDPVPGRCERRPKNPFPAKAYGIVSIVPRPATRSIPSALRCALNREKRFFGEQWQVGDMPQCRIAQAGDPREALPWGNKCDWKPDGRQKNGRTFHVRPAGER